MSQDANGYVLPNSAGAAFRANLNTTLAAAVSLNSGATAPATTYAYMLWADTTTGNLKQRDSLNANWIIIGPMGTAYLGMLMLSGGNMTGGINFARTTVASSATPDIWTGTGNNINYTGTTTATGFAAAPQAGASRILDCAAAAVFTAGANMLIDGYASGANMTVTAGDRVEVFARTTTQFVLRLCRSDGGVVNASAIVMRSYLGGCGMSTAGASTTMSIAAGQAADSTNAVMMSLSAIAKTTAAWAVGTAQGGKLSAAAIAPSTWYYFYMIRRPDTGVVDVGFDVSSSTPTLPTNYTQYRYIGAGFTDGSSNWTAFTQMGRDFYWSTPVLDFGAAGSATAALLTCSVPRGRKIKAFFNVAINNASGAGQGVYISDPSNADLAPGTTTNPLSTVFDGPIGGGGATNAGSQATCWTNTSAQVRHREINTNNVYIATLGWTDLADTNL